MELTAHQNFEILQTRVRKRLGNTGMTAIHHQQAAGWGREVMASWYEAVWEGAVGERAASACKKEQWDRERKSKKHRETDLERDQHHRRSDKEHRDQVRAAKSKVEKLLPRIPPDKKMLTVKMPQTTSSAEPLPLWCQASSSDWSSSSEQPTPPSSAPVSSSDAQTPSPMKMSEGCWQTWGVQWTWWCGSAQGVAKALCPQPKCAIRPDGASCRGALWPSPHREHGGGLWGATFQSGREVQQTVRRTPVIPHSTEPSLYQIRGGGTTVRPDGEDWCFTIYRSLAPCQVTTTRDAFRRSLNNQQGPPHRYPQEDYQPMFKGTRTLRPPMPEVRKWLRLGAGTF